MQSDVVSEAPNNSGLNVTLHPLVIMNMSDHWTRTRAQNHDASVTVYGALLGIQSGREIEVFNSFELPHVAAPDGIVTIDKNYFVTKQEQFRQVFKDYDFLGWYSTGAWPTRSDINVHNQFLAFNESPLFAQLNPHLAATSRDLPLTVYESVMDLVNGAPQTMFVRSTYRVETGEAERIAVDHVAKAVAAEASEGSGLIAHLISQRNAIKMLQTRIRLLYQYVQDVQNGTLPRDHNLLRQISSLCNRLPTVDGQEFRKEFLTDQNDVLLIAYLAALTKGAADVNSLVERFNVAGSERVRRLFGAKGVGGGGGQGSFSGFPTSMMGMGLP
ncbi:Mov34-domain-containing protein [Gonapodya prolifera JEL478]|uniref:COP9 signalosome complex subunit 6 n=1 Tax=Gonapodya prolifera (strain JEL478) TaxID=1344416 RepID=A0A139AQ14_GONPJ|nr:Mov34-domain-containing protein [Gonapodya prolifera JEL478]|eukprot:KXS18839.1 Mov34-domain-containing protein [Gonapodya prolifera JEL478]